MNDDAAMDLAKRFEDRNHFYLGDISLVEFNEAERQMIVAALRRHAQCAPDHDKIALDAARSILRVDSNLPIVQRKARIQCIVLDALSTVTLTPPMLADIAQIIDAGWKSGQSSAEVAAEILREFDGTAVTSTECGGGK